YYPGPRNAPLLIFVHGGYWQGGSKASVGFLAEGPLSQGVSVAMLEYTVAPEGHIGSMIEEVRRALHWLHAQAGQLQFDARRIVLAGHSAGAHLMCNVLDELPILGGIAISG